MSQSFEVIAALADAVMLEGYVLYPYRATTAKNQFRWPFGVLAPRQWSEPGGCESWWTQTECLINGDQPTLVGRLRCLRIIDRTIEAIDAEGRATKVASLEAGGQLLLPWQEGDLREVNFALTGSDAEQVIELSFAAETRVEDVREGDRVVARVRREARTLQVRICVRLQAVAAERPLARLSVRVENVTPWAEPGAPREHAMRASLASTHLLLEAPGGEFLSAMDPPGWATAAAADCQNVRAYPVLAGEPGRRDLMLSAPIILHDHPQLAPESPGDFFDATEIDELLALRTSLLTQDEKRQARATDPRAEALLDRVESMPREVMERLHGAIRELRRIEPNPSRFRTGSRVRLRPGSRRTDAQDLLYAGCTATVEEIRHDIDGRVFLAVLIDGDPAAELHRWYGRFLYYTTDEVEALEAEP